MSKRRIGREVEDLSNEVLGVLTPLERLQFMLESLASGNERWVDRLFETCPRHQYVMADIRFTEAVRTAQQFAWQTVYELQTLVLQYELRETELVALHLAGVNPDEDPPETEPERVGAFAEANSLLFARLYVAYHSNRQFATEVLKVELDEYLSFHPDSAEVLKQVDAALDDPSQLARAKARLAEVQAEATEDETEPAELTLDDLVERVATALCEVWIDSLEERTI